MRKVIDPQLVAMALRMARGFARMMPKHVLCEDMEQAALVGLCDALKRRPERDGPNWEACVRVRIRGEMVDELRRQDWIGRRRKGVEYPKVFHGEDIVEGWADTLMGDRIDPESAAILKVDADRAWRAEMLPIDRRVLVEIYLNNRTAVEVGIQEGITATRICQLQYRGLGRMQEMLTGEDPSNDEGYTSMKVLQLATY